MQKPFILLTGGTGFLGTFLAKDFLEKGKHIFFLVRPKEGRDPLSFIQMRLASIGLAPHFFSQIHIVYGDTTKPLCGIVSQWLEKNKDNIEAIWHIAGLVKFNDRKMLLPVNAESTRHISELAQKFQAHIFYIGTAYVVGASRKSELLEDELESPKTFRNIYEESKYQGEKFLVSQMHAGKISATIFRPSILVGDFQTGQTFSYTGYYVPLFFFALLRKRHPLLTNFPVVIPYVQGATLNLMPVDHAVRIISALADHPESKDKTFHIVNPHPPSIRSTFQESLNQLGYPRVFLVPVPLSGLTLVGFFIKTFSYLFGKSGKRVRAQLLDYLTYLSDTRTFSTKNVWQLLGVVADVPLLGRDFFERSITYALEHNFGRTKVL